jgi:hypothetical protein
VREKKKSLKLLQMKCCKLGQMVRMQVLLCLWNTCFLRVTKTIIVTTKIDAKLQQYRHTHHPLTCSLANLKDHWTRKNYLKTFRKCNQEFRLFVCFFPFLFFQWKCPMPFAALGNNYVWIGKQKKRFHKGSLILY